MSASLPFRPLARFDDLVISHAKQDLLVYDQRSHHIHQLNAVSAATWQLCDGQQSIPDLAQLVRLELGEPVTVEMIELALTQLSGLELLEVPLETAGGSVRQSRRSLLRKAAAGAAVPMIVSVSAAQAMAAQSCTGDSCKIGRCDPYGHCCGREFQLCVDKHCCDYGRCVYGRCCDWAYEQCNWTTCCDGECVNGICVGTIV